MKKVKHAEGRDGLGYPASYINTFSMVEDEVMASSTLSNGAKLLYGLLVRHAGKDAYAYPSIPLLAREMGRSVSMIQRYTKVLVKAIPDRLTRLSVQGRPANNVDRIGKAYDKLLAPGLEGFLPSTPSAFAFRQAIRALHDWNEWEHSWCVGGLKAEALRPYARHYYEGNSLLSEELRRNRAFGLLIDTGADPPTFTLTPQEFENILRESAEAGESVREFTERLLAAVTEKTGKVPQLDFIANRKLMRREMEAKAPEYINASKLFVPIRYGLWKCCPPGYESGQGAQELEGAKASLADRRSITVADGESIENGSGKILLVA